MGVRNRIQVEHRTEVQNVWTRNVAAVLLFVSAVVTVGLLIWIFRTQQTPLASMPQFLYWDQPINEGYRSYCRSGTDERGNGSKERSITDEKQLNQKLDDWANAADQVSLVYLFGQAFLEDGRENVRLILRNTEGGAFDLVKELIDRAKASSPKQLIAFWDLGDGLRTENAFLPALEKQLKDAPDNLRLIVSHGNQESSRWLAQTQSTVFETALRQVLLEQKPDLHQLHDSLAKWVAALTVDCDGASLQTIPEVLSNGKSSRDLSQIQWNWNTATKNKDGGENSNLLSFEKRKSEDDSNGTEFLKLRRKIEVDGLRISDLPKSFAKKISSTGTGVESGRFVDLIARLSCDMALYRFSVDVGLLNKKSGELLKQEMEILANAYSSCFEPKKSPNSADKAIIELSITDSSLQAFENAIEKLENAVAVAIEGSNGDQAAKSLHHVEQKLLWDSLIDRWQKSEEDNPWGATSADAPAATLDPAPEKKRKWPFKFDAGNLTEIAKPNIDKRGVPDDWRFEARRYFFALEAPKEFFPESMKPLADWSWPKNELIQSWQAAKVLAAPAIVKVEIEPDNVRLKFNILGRAELKGTVEFSNSPLGVELEFVGHQELEFTWQVQASSNDSSAEPKPSPPPRSGSKTTFEAGPQPGSGKYEFTVTIDGSMETRRPVEFRLIALAKNVEGKEKTAEQKIETNFLKLANVEVRVETKCPGMEGPLEPSIVSIPEGGQLVLEPLPNLVTEYQFWLTSDSDLPTNAEQINGLWDVELQQGDIVLATAKAVFNSQETKDPKFLAWTARSEAMILDPEAPVSLVIVGQDRTATEIKFRPKSWSDLVKRPDQLPVSGWAGSPFLELVDNPVDPVENWKKYNAAWESKLGPSLEKLRKKDGDKAGVVAEYRVWPSQAGELVTDVVRYDAIKKSEKGLPFPMKEGAKNCFLIASIYGWPQALRYKIDSTGNLDRDQELYGVFLQPIDCEFDPPPSGQWAEPDGSKIYEGWHFFRFESKDSPLNVKIVAEDHRKARLKARWYMNEKDGREAQFKFRNRYAGAEVSGRELTLPSTTKLVWLHPLKSDGEPSQVNHIAICAGVVDTAIVSESEEELLEDNVNDDKLTFTLQSSKINESGWKPLLTLILERGEPKKSE